MGKNHTSDHRQEGQSHSTSFIRGPIERPSWERPALLILLLLTAVAYIWGLNKSGWSNSFYSAAVQAGSKSWKAFFFGSIDAANFITVDKPPAFLWVMDLSARIFGLNSWSILVPEALEGVACVWVLYITVRRLTGPGAALLSGALLAMTPVAALMFRFNNPDALLVLLLTASAYAFTRALEEGKTKWLVWASVLIGIGFLTKMLTAFFVIPGFVIVYLLFGPVSIGRRIVQILISAMTVLVSAGWWVAIVQLMPAADRPYIGSSQKNSILDLIFGYNGFGRLTGNEHGKGGMGGHSGSVASFADKIGNHSGNYGGFGGGQTGLGRLFQSGMGGQISWLIPAALILFVVSVWLIRGNWRVDRKLPNLLMWAATFVITGIVFSFGKGTIHTYYTLALAPAVAALVGIGVDILWKRRDEWAAQLGFGVAIAVTALWSYVLLERTPTWIPWLKIAILVIGVVSTLIIAIGPKLGQNIISGALAAAIVASLAGPFAYTIQTISTPHTGSSPSAGPTVNGGGFHRNIGGYQRANGGNFNHSFKSEFENFAPGNARYSGQIFSRNFSGGGGFGENGTPGQDIIKLLKQDASKYTWTAATVSATSSAPYQLATGDPIMDIGGFMGSDPAPTLSQFKKYVSEGKIHYFITGGRGGFGAGANHQSSYTTTNKNSNNMGQRFNGGMTGHSNRFNSGANGAQANWGSHANSANPNALAGTDGTSPNINNKGQNFNFFGRGMGSGSTASSITNWVQNNFKSKTVDGVTVYDLTKPKS